MEVREVLRKAGVPVRPGGVGWLRAPAVWRGSTDFNLAVNLETGAWILHSTGEKGSWKDLLEFLSLDSSNLTITKPKGGKNASGTTQSQALELWESAYWLTDQYDYRRPFKELAKWRQAATAYLQNRGIPDEEIQRVATQVKVVGDTRTALLLLIPLKYPTLDGGVFGLQRIRLDFSGKKYPWPVEVGTGEAKRMLGPRKVGEGWSTGWWLPGTTHLDRVIICEGPETAIALQAFTGRAIWCLASANGMDMARIEFLAENNIRNVCIAGDCDVTGIIAAADLAIRLKTTFPDWTISVAIPDERKTDWLDVLRESGAPAALDIFRKSIEMF